MKYLLLALALLCRTELLYASTPMQGCVEATNTCPAYFSIKKKSNPGDIKLVSGERYAVVARNKFKDATHYQIVVDNDQQTRRWVSIECGEYIEQCSKEIAPAPVANKGSKERYLLAVSWQPAFCESHQRKPECRSQHDQRFDATHFSLHGLWPQPRDNAYCGVNEKNKAIDRRSSWHLLPELDLDAETTRELAMVMPGVASHLHRHEWIKHGTCYGSSADDYFDDSIKVLEELNRSPVRDLFAQNIGERLSVRKIQSSFDEHFGKGSGKKIGVRCDRKNNITELFINLRGDLDTDTLPELLAGASNGNSNCQNNSGNIDAVGFGGTNQGWFSRWLGSLF